jgi:transposase
MTLTSDHLERISKYFPRQRGNVKIEHLTFLQALLYMAENGCKWRALPSTYGKWNSVYQKACRWAKSGVLERVFMALQRERIITVTITVLALDSTCVKLHPDAHGALKKTASKPSESPEVVGTPNFMWSPQMTRLSWRCTSREAIAMMPPKDVHP